VDGRADVVAEGAAAEGWRVVDVAGLGTRAENHLLGPVVDLKQVGADTGTALDGVQDVGDERATRARLRDLGRGEDLDHRAAPRSARTSPRMSAGVERMGSSITRRASAASPARRAATVSPCSLCRASVT